MANLIFTHQACALHGDVRASDGEAVPRGWGHPEQPLRLDAVLKGLSATDALRAIERLEPGQILKKNSIYVYFSNVP